MLEPALLSDALALAGAFAFDMDEDGRMDFADTARLEAFLVERPGEAATGQADWEARMRPEDVRARRRAVASLSFDGARYRLDYPLRDAMGEVHHVREIAQAVASIDQRATLVRGVLIDRTDDVHTDEAVIWRARHDPLTRLPNRVALAEAGTQLAELGERIGIPVHLLRLRLRNLDRLSATFGEDLRDRMLRQAGERMQAALRAPDLVARLDGADFAAATLNSDPDTLGLRLRAAVTAEPYMTPFGPLSLELDVARAPLETVAHALDATRQDLSGDEADTHPEETLPSVDEALAEDRLSVAFQPIVHADGHALHHYEMLLRLRGLDGRPVSAFPFIVAAEDAGEVHRLDTHVLSLAAGLLDEDPDLRLAVNVSAGTVGDPGHSDAYVAAIQTMGAAAQRLTLELTETLAVDDPAKAAHFSAEVRALGCRFAVDDFASGHTSFRNLLAVEADCIKIDGSLVRGVALDAHKQAFIRMMVDLAATFSVETVAEMVEDRADALVLTRLGVTYLQGYHFGRPGPVPVWEGPVG
ncbi:EAL domain-containing protein [uncultured Algimonas sp.]|uniref:EAL domain-containing protein n=1 Tax=uncultured Algimonas sp. TaxID=1547920 RepID=UPI0026203CD0|nr:EAL domain-containing protein [uncultured Algimonas sp.]